MCELANQTVAIVGASSGIGLATAKTAAGQGARVIMLGLYMAKSHPGEKSRGEPANQIIAVAGEPSSGCRFGVGLFDQYARERERECAKGDVSR